MAKRSRSAATQSRPTSAPANEPIPSDAEEARSILTDSLEWRGVRLSVNYEPDYLSSAARGLSFSISHLEIEVSSPEGAPLPVTETGYRSHFVTPGHVEDAGGPAPFVRRWLDEAARSPVWRRTEARWRQLDLF